MLNQQRTAPGSGQAGAPSPNYDPASRLFKGAADYAPHPAALLTGQPRLQPSPHLPPPPQPDAAMPPSTSPQPKPEPPRGLWTQTPGVPNREFDHGPAPTLPSPRQTATPAGRTAKAAAVLDYSKFRKSTPLREGPRSKLAMLYGRTTPISTPEARKRHWFATPIGITVSAVALVAAAVAMAMQPTTPAAQTATSAMLNTPMLMLRAVGPGQVTSVAIVVGQPVDPAMVLMTIRPSPFSSGAGSAPSDQPIRAGISGVVWSLNARAGALLQSGDPLVQLADCGRAFLVIREGGAALRAGQSVVIDIAGLSPIRGTVRPSAGPTEPANTLVVEPEASALMSTGTCPVGSIAEIHPDLPT